MPQSAPKRFLRETLPPPTTKKNLKQSKSCTSEAIRTTSVEATGHDAMQAFWRVSQVEMVPVLSPTSSVLSFVYAWMNWRRCKFVKIKIKIVGTERPAERHGVGNAARTGQHQAQFSRTSEVKCPSRSSSGTGATWTFRT